MKKLRIPLLWAFLSFAAACAGGEFKPALVDPEPSATIYPNEQQCEQPKVDFSPEVVYPWEMHSGIAGTVDVCVRVDSTGYPIRVAVLRSTQHVFERYALANVMQTTWRIERDDKRAVDGWFVHRVEFVRKDVLSVEK